VQPPPGGGAASNQPDGSLPVTGSETLLIALFALLFLSAGGSIILFTRRSPI
jgi:LPXTG-motif cell wall-anchored protein